MTNRSSSLKAPPAKALERFHIGQIGDDTVGSYLSRGYSLAICCRDCRRLIEWAPPELEARFGTRPGLRIADLAERLACKEEGGCGSDRIAVFPHLYDQPWAWSGGASD